MGPVAWGITAAVAGVCTPVTLLMMREVIRRRRSAMLTDLLETLFKDNPNLPTLEFARNKYGAKPPHNKEEADGKERDEREEERATRSLTRTYTLFFSAIPYLLASIVGFLVLIEPICGLVATDGCGGTWIVPALFWIEHGGDAAATVPQLMNAAAIVGMAFLGGYLFTLRLLLRAVMNFELSPITWLRAAIHILSGAVIALLLYRTLGGTAYLTNLIQLTGSTNQGDAPLRLWLAIAFIAGYVPDFGMATLVRYLHINYFKSVDEEFMKNASIIPIEIIDGIDYDIRFRLEETNIIDIQNLATYNPILLFVETPYGLYESFDWVLQAQLCLVVGPKTFFELKRYKVRTIFDLERAVLGDDAPEHYIRMIGALIYKDAEAAIRDLITTKPAAGEAPAELDLASIKHAVAVMGDDLHVHRLRQLWSEILDQLSPRPGREWLYRSGPITPKPAAPVPPPQP